MSGEAAISVQWRNSGGLWKSFDLSGIPVARPVKIRIDRNDPNLSAAIEGELVSALRELVARVGGRMLNESIRPDLLPVQTGQTVLEVIVSDGVSPVTMEQRFHDALLAPRDAWVMPVMRRLGANPGTLPPELQKQNIAFWRDSTRDLALP